jgi:hypothetical protein
MRAAAAKKLVVTFGTALLALVLAVVVSYVAASPTFGWTGGCSGSGSGSGLWFASRAALTVTGSAPLHCPSAAVLTT